MTRDKLALSRELTVWWGTDRFTTFEGEAWRKVPRSEIVEGVKEGLPKSYDKGPKGEQQVEGGAVEAKAQRP